MEIIIKVVPVYIKFSNSTPRVCSTPIDRAQVPKTKVSNEMV